MNTRSEKKSPTDSDHPPLLFLHGFTCDPSFWLPQTEYFGKSFSVSAPLLPFHGESPADAEPTIDGHAKWALEYVQTELKTPAVVIGHSLGGMVALRMAILGGENLRAVVLADAFPDLDLNRRWLPGLHAPGTDDALKTTLSERMESARKTMTEADFHAMWSSILAFDVVEELQQIKIPVLGIYGGRERYRASETEKLKQELELGRIPNCEVSLIPEAGHFLQLEHPEGFNGILEGFLKRLEREVRDR